MRVIFIIQGEGRGHLTQALALRQTLADAGHEVVGVLVGTAEGREIPAFFTEHISTPIQSFLSPNLMYDTHKGSVKIAKTVGTHLLRTGRYTASLRAIAATVQRVKPDLIVNFYEVLGGLYNRMYRPGVPMVCVAHQYLLLHPHFPFPKNSYLDRQIVKLNTRLTALGAARMLALSFRHFSEEASDTLAVVPPLLRRDIKNLTPITGDYALVYLTHHSLSGQVAAWHHEHPELPLHCFWDKSDAPEELKIDETLTFHQINGVKYLRMMESCRALVTTAGFESVCEAMYLGKPVLMVPVPKHFEQACNAIDGVLSGAGVSSRTFNFSVLTDFLPYFQSPQVEFQRWCSESDRVFIRHLEAVVSSSREATCAPLEGRLTFG